MPWKADAAGRVDTMLFRPNVAKMAGRRVRSGLVKALSHRDPTVRASAAGAIGELGRLRRDHLSPLDRAHRSGGAGLRGGSARAFQRVGKVKDVLEQGFLFAEGDDQTWVTHFHVHRHRPPKQEWAGVEIEVLLRLEGLGVAIVREGLRDRDWRVRESVARLLSSLGAEPTERDLLPWYLVGLHEWGRLRELGEAAVLPLTAALGHPRPVVARTRRSS